MKKIDFDIAKLTPLLSHSSKGNQPKWRYRNKWYKIDSFGYESLAEIVISRLLNGRVDALSYEPVQISYNGEVRMGSVSNNFLGEGDELYTLERLHLIFRGEGCAEQLDKINSTEEKIQYTVDFIKDVTNIDNVGETLTTWLELDAMFLNEDRHTNNIAFVRDAEHNWRWAPYFDNGLSFLSDTKAYPTNVNYSIHKRKIKSKPFSDSFSKQVKAAEQIYGKRLKLQFTEAEIDAATKDLAGYYDEDCINRVKQILIGDSLFWTTVQKGQA